MTRCIALSAAVHKKPPKPVKDPCVICILIEKATRDMSKHALIVVVDTQIDIHRAVEKMPAPEAAAAGPVEEIVVTYIVKSVFYMFYVAQEGVIACIPERRLPECEIDKTMRVFINMVARRQRTRIAITSSRHVVACTNPKTCPHKTEKLPRIRENGSIGDQSTDSDSS